MGGGGRECRGINGDEKSKEKKVDYFESNAL